MTITTSYPGVYVEESTVSSLTVSSYPTCVPAFVVYAWGDPVLRFDSYLDFIQQIGGEWVSDGGNNYNSIRAYFECGGGYCYAIKAENLLIEVPKYPDITLIVSAAYTEDDGSAVNNISTLCQAGSGRFGIVDIDDKEITDDHVLDDYPQNSGLAVYYPWCTVGWTTSDIAPSAIMAGLYCQNDRARGVWKAPANVVLPGGYSPKYKVTDDFQGQYNSGKALNMIRSFDSRGPVVWGARTLEDSDDWRYISVRRLFISAETDIKTAMQSMVFETNNPPTWEKVRTAITNYLHSLWQKGALVGATEKEAYFVQIGKDITMTDDDIAQGKMIVKVGMAAVRPAEFIILQFSQNVEQQ